MGDLVEFSRPDGKKCPAYLALPASGKDAPGFVVIQEWWGVNAQIKGIADRLAAAGYRALVPDLFRGEVAKNAEEASHKMQHLDFMDATSEDIRGAITHLKEYAPGRKVLVGGFCMGGALTILSAMKLDEMDGGVCFYGMPPAAAGDPGTIKVPLQCHFAEIDDWCTPALVDELEAKLKAGGVNHEFYRYKAQHAFLNEARPEVYDAAAAKLAWERALEFANRVAS
jgi:carboxymethylenebutenolidase